MQFNLSIKLEKNTPYLISVSGGVDSMVLLDYLYKEGYSLKVVHFNHLKRKESILDKSLVESYCKNNNIDFYYFELHLDNKDFQNQARKLRKKYLLEVAKKNQINHIITAHHLDDLAETIFMKISRGSSLLGYSGMSASYTVDDITYLKPLLYTPKDDLIRYSKKNLVTYLEDRTNSEDHYFRNRVRHHIIPFLKSETNFKESIIHYHKQLLLAYTYIRKESLAFLNGSLSIVKLDKFLLLDEAVQLDILSYLLESYHIEKTFNLVSSMLDALKNKNKPNVVISLSSRYVFTKSYQKAFITKQEKIDLNLPTPIIDTYDDLLSNIPKNSQEICYNILDYPLTVRRRQNGDVLQFNYGRKKLKDFLIDKKIPLYQRDNLWIVVDSNNQIIWIPNLYINKTLGNQNKIYISLREEQDA
ncbi:tRNA(Ile)-lysidine synthase [Alteracholeplasma palmae J233]|uniref:tRNA(Ile)-lysidine synthase n=1 Tax=Alteracholeplasma palmae (strain ATCC 49389 / J233) TaxID=1318466 RepID=U4KLX9_ALTPJ|nr:tRNA lysidine(34) synthetase TilS [Alteracholeplasma palmae]CCV64972.1 tRNA(Ile)-lysidine synthase [Alteracholeplasma palmae J233]